MEQFKLVHLADINTSPIATIVPPRSNELGQIVGAYARNVSRMVNAFDVLTGVADLAVVWEDCRREAAKMFADDPVTPDRLNLTAYPIALRRAREKRPPEKTPTAEEIRATRTKACELVDMLALNPGYEGMHGVDSMLLSAIVQAWGTFEALAADLWVAALGNRPGWAAKSAGEAIPIHCLVNNQFDVRKLMGTILREEKRFTFNQFGDIENAYRTVLGAVVDPLFGDSNPDRQRMAWLGGMRHVVVHNGAAADDQFLSRMERHPDFAGLKNGDLLPVSGVLVVESIDLSVRYSVALFRMVDDALAERPA